MQINISAGRHKFLNESVANMTLKAQSEIEAKKLKVLADIMTKHLVGSGDDLFTVVVQLMYAFITPGAMDTGDKERLLNLCLKYEPAFSRYLGLPPEEPAKKPRARAKKKPTKQTKE